MVKEKIKSTVQPSLHTDKKLQGYVKNPVLAYPCFLFVLPAAGSTLASDFFESPVQNMTGLFLFFLCRCRVSVQPFPTRGGGLP